MQQKPSSFSIKDWSDDDKPREKLVQKGRAALSNAELIAILIGSGTKNETAVALSKRILSSANNNLNELGRVSLKQLMKFKGIGEAKAVSIAAAMEIGRRRQNEKAVSKAQISGSKAVFNLLQPLIADLPHEEFWIVYLNNSNKVIHKAQLSKGGITGTLVDIRLVMKQALEFGAVSLVLAHNHPSGTLKPSEADKKITKKLQKASEALDIRVLDHVIITQNNYYSFADNNLI
ncbi:RadC family protein [Eudoraea adriatica]|uniref:RadC family protein n=1 Tax=Eudoraea adriatica TaxID=446681 RepID=UPI000381718D|nr:DNA repair protein RadC [Eudoraea adriatica]